MKKTKYTRKQITEAINHWKKVLRQMDESSHRYTVDLIDLGSYDDDIRRTYTGSNLYSIVKRINKDFEIVDNSQISQLDEITRQLGSVGVANCEDFGGDTWRLQKR